MNRKQKKLLVEGVLGIAVGLVINRFLDKKLAKNPNPGRINKLVRWQLKQGRRWGWAAETVRMGLGYYLLRTESSEGSQSLSKGHSAEPLSCPTCHRPYYLVLDAVAAPQGYALWAGGDQCWDCLKGAN